MSETEALQKRFAAALMPNYGVPPVAISRGVGLPGMGPGRA